MKNKKILVFNVDPTINGGESIYISSELHYNGDDKTEKTSYWLSQEIILRSYGNSASLNLSTAILSPEILRKMANQLEEFIKTAIEENIMLSDMTACD